jgi:putative ABC transport system permease protein
MRRDRLYSVINVFGLGLGLAIGFVLLYWVNSQYTMNAFHKKADRIYQVNMQYKPEINAGIMQTIAAPAANYAREHIPDLENIVRLRYSYSFKQPVKADDKIFIEDKWGYTENAFFDIFDFPIVMGSSKEPFAQGLTAVLSESTAKKYFGNENPIGKIIRFRDTTLQVSAIMKDFPASSSLQFDMLFSLELQKLKFRGNGEWKTIDQDWGNGDYYTYALMKPGGNTARASKILVGGVDQVFKESGVAAFPFRPLKNIYLYKPDGSKGRLVMVQIFLLVGVFILLIAAINYINLVTARATQRVKEISMRKILGAEKRQLFVQFFCETGLLLFLSILTAVFIIQVLLPAYSQITGTSMQTDIGNWQLWKVLLMLVAGVWLLSGLYPALLLSSFLPVQAMRGTGFFARTGFIRKSLVVLQFVVSITLFLGTVFVHRQLDFIRGQDLSLNTDHVIGFSTWRIDSKGAAEMKSEVQKMAGVSGYTSGNIGLFEGVNSSGGLEWPGKPKDESFQVARFEVDNRFLNFFDIKLLDGSNLDNVSVNSPDFILNETAIQKMGLKNPVGTAITWNGVKGTIIGVVKDFHFKSMHEKMMPALIQYVSESNSDLYVRVQPQYAKTLIASAEKVWKKYEAVMPMEYHYLNDQVAAQYDMEIRASRLFDVFAIVTMLISCLGLFGLTTYSAERRIKEIGIRKVLGAGVANIAVLLSTEFIRLVIIATIIAIPIVWYCMNLLLENFAYRIELSWWVFALTAAGAIAIALFTMSFQAIRAGLANPVKSLRTE